jgi:diguanylate cyclase (GGDEF)-like protein
MTKNINDKPLILIVDDTPMNIRVLGTALQEEYQIRVATSGEEALEMATKLPVPDLILLDIMMPEMNGFQVLEVLKSLPETKEIPVIFVTALSKEADEEKGLKIGAIDYITKPYSIPVLKARVKNHIELKKLRDVIKENSMLDGLTKIPNKNKFNEILEAEWSRARRYEENLSVLMLDLDFFKIYNDTYGHLEGDECLKMVAYTLKNLLKRGTDLVARWGGEEFACILPGTNYEGAMKLAEELRKGIENLQIPHEASTVSKYVTISVGVATMIPTLGTEPQEIVEKADKALYRAKQDGRNRARGDASIFSALSTGQQENN